MTNRTFSGTTTAGRFMGMILSDRITRYWYKCRFCGRSMSATAEDGIVGCLHCKAPLTWVDFVRDEWGGVAEWSVAPQSDAA